MNLGQNYASSNDPNLYRRNVNQNLVGMNTQFMNNSINGNRILQDKNEYGNAMVENNVLPHPGLKSTLINKPYKLVLYKNFGTESNTHTFTLNETLKDVVSVKLLKAQIIGTKTTLDDIEFFVLHIDELKKNYGDNGTTDKLKDSFAIIDLDKVSDNGTANNFYENTYACNEDIKYFDPPLNALSKLNCSLYSDNATTINGKALQLKLEFLIETKEKLRVY